MIGARAIVTHAAAKLREQEHQHVVGRVVLPQIGEEGRDPFRHFLPQRRMRAKLAGMRVKGP